MEVMENIELYGVGSCIQEIPGQRIDRTPRSVASALLTALIKYIFPRFNAPG